MFATNFQVGYYLSMDKCLFFGYGSNRNRSKIRQIIGRDPGDGVGAIVEGYSLYIQNLEQIPEPAQSDLKNTFGDFRAFTMRAGRGIIAGIIWSITPEELEVIKQWEYVGIWREIVEITVKSEDFYAVKVLTEKSMDIYPISEKTDGIVYTEFEFKELQNSHQEDEYYTKLQIEKIKNLLSLQK